MKREFGKWTLTRAAAARPLPDGERGRNPIPFPAPEPFQSGSPSHYGKGLGVRLLGSGTLMAAKNLESRAEESALNKVPHLKSSPFGRGDRTGEGTDRLIK